MSLLSADHIDLNRIAAEPCSVNPFGWGRETMTGTEGFALSEVNDHQCNLLDFGNDIKELLIF